MCFIKCIIRNAFGVPFRKVKHMKLNLSKNRAIEDHWSGNTSGKITENSFTLDAGSNKNIKEIEILLKRNWSFMYHIFIKEIERNIWNLDSIFS